MRKIVLSSTAIIALIALGLSAPVLAADNFWDDNDSFFLRDGYKDDAPAFSFSASGGVLALEGREHVFAAAGSENNASLLIWQSVAPMVSANANLRLPGGWTIKAEGRVAAGGQSYMEDYDWLGPYAPSYDSGDWSHRSQHSDTNLDWFVDGSLSFGQDVSVAEDLRVNVNAGFAYTDVQWAAVGGTFVHSVAGLRDTSGTFANSPAITYRQQLPSAFVGLDASHEMGMFKFDAGMRAGVAFMQRATDWHWMRTPPLRYEDSFTPTPTLGGNARVAMMLGDHFELFVDGRVDNMFLARGDTTIYNNSTGAQLGTFTDQAGTQLLSGSVSAGMTGKF